MQVEDDRDPERSAVPDGRARIVERGSGATDVGVQLATLVARLTGFESELDALKTGMSIIESRLTGIENRQRHAESRRERIEARFSDFGFGVDRVHSDMVTLKDRVRRVELDLRELSGSLWTGSSHGADTPGPLSYSVSHPVGLKSS